MTLAPTYEECITCVDKEICAILPCCGQHLGLLCVTKLLRFNKWKCCFCRAKLFDDEEETLFYVAGERAGYGRVFKKPPTKIIPQLFNAKKQGIIFPWLVKWINDEATSDEIISGRTRRGIAEAYTRLSRIARFQSMHLYHRNFSEH